MQRVTWHPAVRREIAAGSWRGGGLCGELLHQLHGAFVEHSGLIAAPEETHAALLPEARERNRPGLRSRRDPAPVAGVTHGFHRLHHLRMLKLARHTERNG